MIGIYEDLEVVVQVLAHVTTQLGRNNARGFGIKAMNPEIHRVPGIQNTHFCFLCGRFTLLRLALPKICDWFC
jgi:hypothetical protein